MKKYITFALLTLAIVLALVTRFYKLGEIPKGFYVDEAGQGYSAYSILKTGKDEFGKSFPIIFRSLTDFKTPVYTYIIIPFIPIFGLNTFTVRLPSALFGVLAIPILYLLIKQLSNSRRISIVSALLLAISPWHILFGRTDFECMVSLTLLLGGIYFFYLSLKKPFFLTFSAILLAISLPAYQAERILVPIITTVLFIKHRKILLGSSHRFYFLLSVAIAFIITLPTLSVVFTPGFFVRAAGLNIFSHARQMPDGFIYNYDGILSPVINSPLLLTTREFFGLYFSYFSPRYMFMLGDYGARSSFPELSTFFLWQFPFYIYGLWVLIMGKVHKELKFLVILLFITSPIPAAITRDPYTTIRALPLVIPQIIIISIGMVNLYLKIKKNIYKYLLLPIFVLVIAYSLAKLYSSVFLLSEHYRARAWEYGWREVSEVILKLPSETPVVVDNARADGYPQLAFFLKYDPIKFQNKNFEVFPFEYYTNMKHIAEKNIGNVTTRSINWEHDLIRDQYLVGDELAISLEQIRVHNLALVTEIDFPDGRPAFRIVRTNPTWETKNRLKFNK